MRIFGYEITRTKAAPPVPVYENRGWYRIFESFTGAWQQNVTVDLVSVLSNPVVFACTTRIASDAASMPMYLEQKSGNIWEEVENPAYSPFLRRPNNFQTHVQFKEAWFLSKLFRGNTYMLKERDARGVVVAGYILHPERVKPMIADDGSVFYNLHADNMAGGELPNDVMVPASEIIHDRYNCLYHPLVGLSPLYAAGVAAMQGLAIQDSSANFFANKAIPAGVLTADGAITQETADRLKETWQSGYTGANAGKVAVLGDGLKFEKLTQTAVESEVIKQLGWTAEAICAAYHMPPFIAGFGPLPANSTVESVTSLYYSLCLKDYVSQFEACMNEGLGLVGPEASGKRVQLDEEFLLRMDRTAKYKAIGEGIRGGFLTPNEGRAMDNRPKINGGDTVYLQEQDHALEALAKRDAGDDPFGTKAKTPAPAPAPANDNADRAAAYIATRKRMDDLRRQRKGVH
jgi:HK97 family phage portal protein